MIRLKIVTALFSVLLATSLQAAQWQMLPQHSQLTYLASYEGQHVSGVFHLFTVTLDFDSQQPQLGTLQVTVQTASADMNSSDVNNAIEGRQWFDAKQYPIATFISQKIHEQSPGHYVAQGILSLKGVKKTVQVPFTWQASGDKATMTGRINLRRTDFNIGTGEWSSGKAIGLDVILSYDIRLQNGNAT